MPDDPAVGVPSDAADGPDPTRPRGPRGALIAGRYRLEHRIASGGMADVWTALDEVLTRRVALKILQPATAADPVLRERFRREAQLAARLNHRCVVAVYDTISDDTGRDGPVEAVVQELVSGETLKDRLDTHGRIPIGDAVRIGIAVADALEAVHRAGIVHRDVKPANILLADDRRVLLTDFGIATHGRQDLTRDDVMMGTAKYLSPEQVEGRPATTAADLYSLGVVLYECLAGRAPFTGETEAATALARLRGDPIPLRAVRPGVPHRMAGLIAACMARRPADRPLSASVVRQSLVRILPAVVEDQAVEPPPLRPRFAGERARARRRHRHGGRDEAVAGAASSAAAAPAGAPGAGAPDAVAPAAVNGGAPPTGIPLADRTAGVDGPRRGPRRWARRVGRALVILCVMSAVIATTVLLIANRSDTPIRDVGEPPVTVAATSTTATPSTSTVTSLATTVATVAVAGDPVIVSTAEFDPPPGDGKENPALLSRMVDRDPSTYWTSLCYDDTGLGQKDGIGVIFQLSADAADHRLEITSTTRGWAASVFVAETRPDRLRAWGSPVASKRDVSDAVTSFALGPAHGTFVLLWFTHLGPSEDCRLPYAVRVAEARVLP